ncbi:MAG: hypothetical protein CM15mP58_11090 [Burkholderiaceae bacterium]|nr:MAG: hypothetical protein CM15mP58_11090 [Burkholderiaceae bacterium]
MAQIRNERPGVFSKPSSRLKLDGHTNLDNVSILVTTKTDDINIDADNKKLQIGDSQVLNLLMMDITFFVHTKNG